MGVFEGESSDQRSKDDNQFHAHTSCLECKNRCLSVLSGFFFFYINSSLKSGNTEIWDGMKYYDAHFVDDNRGEGSLGNLIQGTKRILAVSISV